MRTHKSSHYLRQPCAIYAVVLDNLLVSVYDGTLHSRRFEFSFGYGPRGTSFPLHRSEITGGTFPPTPGSTTIRYLIALSLEMAAVPAEPLGGVLTCKEEELCI